VTSMKRQVTIKSGSRADFVLEQASGKPRIVEVKTVVDTDYCATWPLPDRAKCVFTSDNEPYVRTAIFPWGTSNQKGPDGEPVVSARAIKHVRELTSFVASGEYDATILFLVIRGDAGRFRPNHGACPSFTKYLRQAQQSGVQLLAKSVQWSVSPTTTQTTTMVDSSSSSSSSLNGDDEGHQLGQCFDDVWLDIEWP